MNLKGVIELLCVTSHVDKPIKPNIHQRQHQHYHHHKYQHIQTQTNTQIHTHTQIELFKLNKYTIQLHQQISSSTNFINKLTARKQKNLQRTIF